MSIDSATISTGLAAQYDRDGFVIVPDVLGLDECRALKEEGLKVLREHAKPTQSVYVGVAVASKMYYDLASDPRIVEILKQLMPDGVMFMSDKFCYKSGQQRFATPWHCDIAYWEGTRPKVSVWIPLEDATVDNGALKVVPGGHKQAWQHGNGNPAHNGEFTNVIPDMDEATQGGIVCEMTAGSLLFFSDRLPHASRPNTSGADRYAIIGTYHAPAEDEPFDIGFDARHVIVPGPSSSSGL